MNEQLIEEGRAHLRQLAPHVKERDTGRLMEQLVDALEDAESKNAAYRGVEVAPIGTIADLERQLAEAKASRDAWCDDALLRARNLAEALAVAADPEDV